MAGENVKWVDMGMRSIMSNIQKLGETRLQVGVLGHKADQQSTTGGGTLGQVALINEFGAPKARIPERSFIRAAAHHPRAESIMQNVVKSAMTGNVDGALHAAGNAFAEIMRDKIYHTGGFVGNAASTVKKKGFDHPLMDSSQLADAISHQLYRINGLDVVDAGGEGNDYEAFNVSSGSGGELSGPATPAGNAFAGGGGE